MDEETSTGLSSGSQFDFLKHLISSKTDQPEADENSLEDIGDELRDEVDVTSLTSQGVYMYKK